MHVRVLVRVQIACVQMVERQGCEEVHDEPPAQVVEGDCLRVGHHLTLARDEGGAEIQDNICVRGRDRTR